MKEKPRQDPQGTDQTANTAKNGALPPASLALGKGTRWTYSDPAGQTGYQSQDPYREEKEKVFPFVLRHDHSGVIPPSFMVCFPIK